MPNASVTDYLLIGLAVAILCVCVVFHPLDPDFTRSVWERFQERFLD
jgi:hypothetical protein